MRNKMKSTMRETLSTILYLAGVVCVTLLIITYVGQRTSVEGTSMEPTLDDGDNLIVDKLTYRFQDPERFDIIVFPFQYEEKVFYIKRIIGLPGETVWIDEDGTIYVGESEDSLEVLTESYGKEVILPEKIGIASNPVTLGEDEYFVMGDNRNNSSDSRLPVVGNIHRDDIIGRAWLRIWPLDKFGVLKHQ